MKTISLKIAFTFFVLISLASCRSITSNRMFETSKDYRYSEFSLTQKEYIIQPYDEFTMMVRDNKGSDLINDKDLRYNVANQVTYRIEKNGKVKLPSLGWVSLVGLTIKQAQQLLEKKYEFFITDPFVYITITNRRVIVFANGSSNGKVVHFTNDNFTLIEALAESGGISDFGKAYKIKLLRGDLNNPDVFHFDVRDLEEVKKANFQILSNDIIYVEARPRYASKILREITPYLSLFTSVFTIYILLSK